MERIKHLLVGDLAGAVPIQILEEKDDVLGCHVHAHFLLNLHELFHVNKPVPVRIHHSHGRFKPGIPGNRCLDLTKLLVKSGQLYFNVTFELLLPLLLLLLLNLSLLCLELLPFSILFLRL